MLKAFFFLKLPGYKCDPLSTAVFDADSDENVDARVLGITDLLQKVPP